MPGSRFLVLRFKCHDVRGILGGDSFHRACLNADKESHISDLVLEGSDKGPPQIKSAACCRAPCRDSPNCTCVSIVKIGKGALIGKANSTFNSEGPKAITDLVTSGRVDLTGRDPYSGCALSRCPRTISD